MEQDSLASQLADALAKVERLAESSKWKRFLAAPLPYLQAAVFNKLVYPIRKRAWLRSCQLCFGIPFQVALPAATDIFLTGGKTHASERQLARFLLHHLRDGMTYVDVGAHYGYFLGLAAQLNPHGCNIGFEPSPSTYALLRQNMQNLPVQLHQKGVGAQSGQLTFYQFPAKYSEYNSLDIAQYEGQAWAKAYPPTPLAVAITTLDEQLQAPPDILKIDVEGAEDQVLSGAEKWLALGKTQVLLEYLPAHSSNGSHGKAHRWLLEKGYRCHRLSAEGQPILCPDPEAWLLGEGVDSTNLLYLAGLR